MGTPRLGMGVTSASWATLAQVMSTVLHPIGPLLPNLSPHSPIHTPPTGPSLLPHPTHPPVYPIDTICLHPPPSTGSPPLLSLQLSIICPQVHHVKVKQELEESEPPSIGEGVEKRGLECCAPGDGKWRATVEKALESPDKVKYKLP